MSIIKSLFALSLTTTTLIIDIDIAAAAVDVSVNSTWPLSCDTYIGMDLDINMDKEISNVTTGDVWVCQVFCGAEGNAQSIGPHRSTSTLPLIGMGSDNDDNNNNNNTNNGNVDVDFNGLGTGNDNDNDSDQVVTGIQYRVCACDAEGFNLSGESITINFNDNDNDGNTEQELSRSQKACKYEEVELTLPNSVDDVSCSDVGLGVDCGDDNSGDRNNNNNDNNNDDNNNDCLQDCSVYCSEVIFKDFVSLDLSSVFGDGIGFVSGGYSSNAKGVCRCYWGEVTIDACTGPNTNGDISKKGGGESSRATIAGTTSQFLVFLNIAAIVSTAAGVMFL